MQTGCDNALADMLGMIAAAAAAAAAAATGIAVLTVHSVMLELLCPRLSSAAADAAAAAAGIKRSITQVSPVKTLIPVTARISHNK